MLVHLGVLSKVILVLVACLLVRAVAAVLLLLVARTLLAASSCILVLGWSGLLCSAHVAELGCWC